MTTGARIKAARDKRGLTQQQLADAIGAKQNEVSRWEAGSTPRADTAVKLADALEVRERWLITGEGPMERAEVAA